MNRTCITTALILWCFSVHAWAAGLPYENDYAFGVDASFVKQHVDQGTQFKDANEVKSPLRIFRDHGYNWARIHLCNEPVRLPQTMEYVTASGRDIKELGMKFLLDLMLSNGWANPMTPPGNPGAWVDMTHDQRTTAVHDFCRDTIAVLRDANSWPDMVQVGNEIGNGFFGRPAASGRRRTAPATGRTWPTTSRPPSQA